MRTTVQVEYRSGLLTVRVGDEIELRGPIGGWFVWRSDQTEPIQLVAGGSGIVRSWP
jgi:NAD(P)H-flavin reductase